MSEAAQYQAAFDVDCDQDQFVLAHANVAFILHEARRLSAKHTMGEGYRTLDIIQSRPRCISAPANSSPSTPTSASSPKPKG
ncbi:MAG: hypothetical protein WDO13_10640 [Verrucomicrobiota bacterium]